MVSRLSALCEYLCISYAHISRGTGNVTCTRDVDWSGCDVQMGRKIEDKWKGGPIAAEPNISAHLG